MTDDNYLTIQATIQFKIHKWGVMDDTMGIFNNATDDELLDYCIKNFEGHVKSVDGDAIGVIIKQGEQEGQR